MIDINRRGFIKAFAAALVAPAVIKLEALSVNPIEIQHTKRYSMEEMGDIHHWWFHSGKKTYYYSALIYDELPKAEYDGLMSIHADRAYEELTRAWRAKA